MDIHFACDQCGQRLSVQEEAAGQEIECPACGKTLTVPGVPSRVAPTLSKFFDLLKDYHEANLEISSSNLGLDSVLVQTTNVQLRNALNDLLQGANEIMEFLEAASMEVTISTDWPPKVDVTIRFDRK